jgi:hypothetical protein
VEIQELVNDIRTQNLVLPEFQREYVWTKEQAKVLLASLIKQYPVGSLLFWKTTEPPELKNVPEIPSGSGTMRVILDGQQRLTTLYMLITGKIPPYYDERDIQNDPRDLYFNLDTREFMYYQVGRMRDNPLWKRVTDCFLATEASSLAFDIARRRTGEAGEQAFALAQHLTGNLDRLRHVIKMVLPVQTVPVTASLDEAIDIFDLVNSQGTKLSEAELALTHVTGKWSVARRVIKEKIAQLARRNFRFDLTFMTRALTVVVTQRALFETIHARPREELETGWTKLSKILDYLVNILPSQAYIHSTEDISTTNALVPLVMYLSLHEGKFPSQTALRNAIHWLYAALMWARYTAQTDQRLEKDIADIVREDNPWDTLRAHIIDQRGRIEVKANDLEGRGISNPLFKGAFIISKARGAVDWFNGVPLGKPHGATYKIHKHHIFPVALLYKGPYHSDSHIHGKLVNEIANRAFLTAESNVDLSDTSPHEYLPRIERTFPGALASQYVPLEPALWTVDRFQDFLAERRRLMADAINEYMQGLVSEEESHDVVLLHELIARGESAQLEFKTSLQWDARENKVNKILLHSVVKTIAGFMNTEGGTLVIGVEDGGAPYGIEHDIKSLSGTRDRFEQRLVRLIADSIGTEFSHLAKIRYEQLEGHELCVVNVNRAPEPIFAKGPNGESSFYVRSGNATRSLDPEETTKFVAINWQ